MVWPYSWMLLHRWAFSFERTNLHLTVRRKAPGTRANFSELYAAKGNGGACPVPRGIKNVWSLVFDTCQPVYRKRRTCHVELPT